MDREGEAPSSFPPKAGPLLVVLSGPSGVGKDAVVSRLKDMGYPLYYAVTATTRPQRPGERDGLDYLFLSEAAFDRMLANQEFLEWARVYGHRYGVPRFQIKEALSQGWDVMVKVDVQGAATIKSLLPEALFIFLVPPSLEELVGRLRQRNTETARELALRINKACQEMQCLPVFDYMVVNERDRLDLAVAQIKAIITVEKCRVKPRIVNL